MKKLDELIEVFSKLQGVGKKSATRLAFDILNKNKSEIDRLIFIIQDTYNSIKPCKICNSLTENEICDVCSSDLRDKSIICVVETPRDVIAFEKANVYKGLYHVLGGKIDPLNDITPDKLNIESLLDRIDENVKEIILAMSSDIEGESTMMYLSNILSDKNIVVSRIASGIPIGTNIEYVDTLTLNLSILGRRNIDK